ncbi:MAG: MoaD/ThiS family protein [Phycisphaerae bacterium]|nr:MoaD/ThiS family protein [Phycisphaerae bacterium]
MIRVILPTHLRALASVDRDVWLDLKPPVTIESLLDELESRYPALRGAIRDYETRQRRPLVRFFACEEDWSHEPMITPLPQSVLDGKDPFTILGAIAGG